MASLSLAGLYGLLGSILGLVFVAYYFFDALRGFYLFYCCGPVYLIHTFMLLDSSSIILVAGLVLLFLALRYLSIIYRDRTISRYAFYFITVPFVGSTGSIIALIALILITPFDHPPTTLGILLQKILVFLLTFITPHLVASVAAYFLYKSLSKLSKASGDRLFRTSGLATLSGSIVMLISAS